MLQQGRLLVLGFLMAMILSGCGTTRLFSGLTDNGLPELSEPTIVD